MLTQISCNDCAAERFLAGPWRTVLAVFVCCCGLLTEVPAGEVHVAVYNDDGAGRSLNDLVRALRGFEDVYVEELTAKEIGAGNLTGFDLVIHPGGSGGKQGRALGGAGREVVRNFVSKGGGFIGICAGSYLASAHYDWSLHILDAEVVDRAHWARGTGMVEIGWSGSGIDLFGSSASGQSIYYGQGPLLAPARRPEIPDFESLARYRTEIAKNGAPEGVMIGTTAIALGKFGRGNVICFSPHPEMTPGQDGLLERAIVIAKRRKESQVAPPPRLFVHAVQRTPDISQKQMPNGNYCGPCSLANVLYQFEAQGRLKLPARFKASKVVSDAEAGRSLARLLGDAAHVNALEKRGANRYRLVNGLWRFLGSIEGASCTGDYLGVRRYDKQLLRTPVRPQLRAVVGIPRLRHLQERIAAADGVVILFGSYKPDERNGGRLERIGGHYVAAVGYGVDAAGVADPEIVILHDSNDGVVGNKHVRARTVKAMTELWDDGNRLARSRELVRLDNAPIRKDGRVAFLETIFSFRPTSGSR